MDAQLENVLDAYAASDPGPSRATLVEWAREYPQFARELAEFTAKWQLLEWADEAPSADPVSASELAADDDRRLLRGMSAAQSAFYTLRAKRQAARPHEADVARAVTSPKPASQEAAIPSLHAAAKRVGLSHAELKDRVGLSDALLQKLNRRLIDPLTIPVRILSDLATALQQRTEAIVAYVGLAPSFAVGAQHRADQAPTLPKAREDFFDAVRNDAALSEARREELLALPRPRPADGSPER